MPNHVEQSLIITGPEEVIKEIACSHFGKDDAEGDTFDCNSLIPMPVSMHITSGGHVSQFAYLIGRYPEIAEMLDKDISKINYAKLELLLENDTRMLGYIKQNTTQEKMSNQLAESRKFISNSRKYGYTDWYSWCLHKWDTKWGAYDGVMNHDDTVITAEFNSAWSPPIRVIKELAELYPEVHIRHAFLDEGYGFGGIMHYADSKNINEYNADDVAQFAQEEFGHVLYEEEEGKEE